MQKGKGILVGTCPKCGELFEIDLIEQEVYGGKFETVIDKKYERVFITCPSCEHREEEEGLRLNI